jgi:hypothetical protein
MYSTGLGTAAGYFWWYGTYRQPALCNATNLLHLEGLFPADPNFRIWTTGYPRKQHTNKDFLQATTSPPSAAATCSTPSSRTRELRPLVLHRAANAMEGAV